MIEDAVQGFENPEGLGGRGDDGSTKAERNQGVTPARIVATADWDLRPCVYAPCSPGNEASEMSIFDAFSPSPLRPYIGRYGKPGISRRELPCVFLVIAIAVGCIALLLLTVRWLTMANESDLYVVSGSVLQTPELIRPSSPVIRILIAMDGRPVAIYEDDLSLSQQITNLKWGDQVSARVKFLRAGVPRRSPGEYHIWELKRDGVTIQSYQDAYRYQTRVNERQTTNALELGLLSALLLAAALSLRMHFGAWVDPTPIEVQDP